MKKDLLDKYNAPTSLKAKLSDDWSIDDIKDIDDLVWLYYSFPLKPEEKERVVRELQIEDTEGFYLSHHLLNCHNIINSAHCENSSNVRNSTWIKNSKNVDSSKNIEDSIDIYLSMSIYKGLQINDCEELENCSLCTYCDDGANIHLCYRCQSINDAFLCNQCIDCHSILGCYRLKHQSNRILCDENCNPEIGYAICNKKVSESTYIRTKERLEEILNKVPLYNSLPNAINGYFSAINDAQIWRQIFDVLPLTKVEDFCYNLSFCSTIFDKE